MRMNRMLLLNFLIMILLAAEGINDNSIIDCPITSFRYLQKVENSLHIKLKYLFDKIKERISVLGFNLPYESFSMAGSTKEGCFSPRLFEEDKDYKDGIHRKFEIDFEISLFKISTQFKQCFEDIEEKPGFVRIKLKEKKCMPKAVKDLTLTFESSQPIQYFLTDDGYVNSNKVKNVYCDNMRFGKQHKYVHTTKLIAAFLYNIPLHQITMSNVKTEVSKAVSTFKWNVHIMDELKLKISSDFALVLKLEWTPYIMKEYINRKRNWPIMNDVEKELKSVYVIAKSSNEERNNVNSTEFRYSFSILERKLVSLQSQSQRLIYLIFKSIIYKWIKPIHPMKLSSFIAKNIMLWTCENYPPEHKIWDNDNGSIIKIIRYLLYQLYEGFNIRFIPYIFVPHINILQSLPLDIMKEVAFKAKQMYLNPLKYIPKDKAERVIEYLQNFLNTVIHAEDIIEEFKEYGPSVVLLRRPDLLKKSKYLDEFITNYKDNIQGKTDNQQMFLTVKNGNKMDNFMVPWYI